MHGPRFVSNKQAVAQKALALKPKPLCEVRGADVLRFYFSLDAVENAVGRGDRLDQCLPLIARKGGLVVLNLRGTGV